MLCYTMILLTTKRKFKMKITMYTLQKADEVAVTIVDDA
jgi:hypothetical protein